MGAISQNAESEARSGSFLELAKWLLSVVLIAGAIVGNSYFSEVALLYRVLAVISSILVALTILSTTQKGRMFVGMLKEARIEVRKVVWPTKQETLQTTAGVVLIVLVVAVLLWLLDMALGWLVSQIIG